MFLTKQKFLLVKEETEYGTDPTPTVASNAIEAMDIQVSRVGEVLERNIQRETLSPSKAILGKRSIEIKFACELKGSGSAGTAPKIGDLLEACGFAETVSAGSSVSYSPASKGMKSVTIYVYEVNAETGNYKLQKATGCVGEPNFIFEAGQIAKVEFSFKGKYNAPSDVADPGDPTYESTSPAIVESGSLEFDSETELVISKLNVQMGNEVSERDDISSSEGLKGFKITGRKPTGSFDPEAVLNATYNFDTAWVNSSEKALEFVVGETAGNIITVSAPKVTVDSIADGDRNGMLTRDIPFRLGKDSGDDELLIVFT